MAATTAAELKKCDSFTLWALLIPTGWTNVSQSINLMLFLNLVFLTIFFSHISLFISFYFSTYLSHCVISTFTSLYNHLFIYLSVIHSNEGLQSESSVIKFFSLRCIIDQLKKLPVQIWQGFSYDFSEEYTS